MKVNSPIRIESFVPRWLKTRLALGWGEPTPRIEAMRAAVLFADITGFSGLTREFSSKGDIGVEQLTLAVSDYFEKLFQCVTNVGGDIEGIYGDGFMAFWMADADGFATAASEAWRCGRKLTASFDRYQLGAKCEFRLRVAVLEGDVFALKAGGVGDHWLFFLAGDCLSEVSSLLATSGPGQVAASSSFRRIFGANSVPNWKVGSSVQSKNCDHAIPLAALT